MQKRYYSEIQEESFNQERLESLIISVGVNVPSLEKEIWHAIVSLDNMAIGETKELMQDSITRIR